MLVFCRTCPTCQTFQMCFDNGLIPNALTQAIICPIPKLKSNDPRLPLSYRGLSILSCIYKIYSSILNTRILKYWEDNGILNDEQNGFRSKRSCLDHIHSIFSIVRSRINSGNSVFTCMVDFRKAFDLVPRELLLFRLLEYGIDGKMYNAVKNIYSQSTCAVRINECHTKSTLKSPINGTAKITDLSWIPSKGFSSFSTLI